VCCHVEGPRSGSVVRSGCENRKYSQAIPSATMESRVNDGSLSFATDIKPLFREHDRRSMESHFDLWSYADVRAHASDILERLQNGLMPCDGGWPLERVQIFKRWVESDEPA
jgi:hypothetical protein